MTRRVTEYFVFAIVAAGFLTMAFAAGYLTRDAALPLSLQSVDTPTLDQAHSILTREYLGELPSGSALEYGMIRGMVAAIGDPFTVFVEPAAHELETEQLAGEFGGVGVTLTHNEQMQVVLDVVPGGPAEAAGIREGDRLLQIDGADITPEMSLDEIAALIRGPVGTEVSLTVRPRDSDQLHTVKLERSAQDIPSVEWRLLDEDLSVGVIAISRFSERTPEEVRQALGDLTARGASRLIMDLRNNGGGLLEASVEVAKLFLDSGVVMYEQRRGEPEQTFEAAGGGPLGVGLPLVVMVNGGTASAAEVVAGALSQRGRAPLIGQKTFGKGSVQSIFELRDGSSLHVTSARWYTPDRSPLDGHGLDPTIPVEPAFDGADAEIARALLYFVSGQ